MSEPSPSRNRRSATPDGMVVVVRDHLRTVLMRTATPFPCTYACFVHPRRRPPAHPALRRTAGGLAGVRIAVVFDTPYARWTPEDHHKQMAAELGGETGEEPEMEYQVGRALEANGHEVLLVGIHDEPRE